MMRQVQAPDGRTWTVRSEVNWVAPALGDDFEHDVAPGYVPAFILGLIVALLLTVLIAWTPDQVVVPNWLIALFIVGVLAIPARWLWQRPWTLVAEVPDDDFYERPGERWVGTVTGPRHARSEAVKIARHIADRSGPDLDGPLQMVD
ncbi:hypothetical protein [Sciscionella marina]|uniref:hypothetical protein n=1 Tax=Sciscionella marina TaxID=508770 RepID=UPI00036A74F0|nr:hypothetical protein [Sciscionella marina]